MERHGTAKIILLGQATAKAKGTRKRSTDPTTDQNPLIRDPPDPTNCESLTSQPPSESPIAPLRAGSKQVLTDLAWCGPDCQCPRWGLDQAFEYCEKLAKSHYENFSVTHAWLPRDIRPHFCSIYAYCRWSDDLADELDDPVRSVKLLRWWRDQLQKASHGQSLHPVFVALHHTMETYSLSIVPFDDLLSAFIQDQSVTSYEDDLQLLDYCKRSADPVGRILLGLARIGSPQAFEWSDSICTGLQIANFCQDVALDASRGRFYLPKERMDRGRITQSQWVQGSDRAPKVLEEWTEQARLYLSAGARLSELGPNWFRRSVRLFVGGGLQILDNIARNRFDVWSHPVEVTKLQKIQLAVRAVFGTPKAYLRPTRT